MKWRKEFSEEEQSPAAAAAAARRIYHPDRFSLFVRRKHAAGD